MFEATGDEVRADVPTFCPRCGKPGRVGNDLCAECGETLRPQGYCAICEVFWRRDVGSDCPKHDVELVDDPPRHEPFGRPGERPSLVTVETYSHPNQASGPRIRLEAEGIPTFLEGERVAGSTPYQIATGGVRLQVPAAHASAARILIAQTWTPPTEIAGLGDDDWDDPENDVDADREAARGFGFKFEMIAEVAFLVFLFGPALILAIRWLYHLGQ